MTEQQQLRDTYVALIRQIARSRKITPNKLFNDADRYGLTSNWMRERYYGRAKIDPADIERLKLISVGEATKFEAASRDARAQAAVNAFCKTCVGEDIACRFRTCELRPVSPYPYIKLETKRTNYYDL